MVLGILFFTPSLDSHRKRQEPLHGRVIFHIRFEVENDSAFDLKLSPFFRNKHLVYSFLVMFSNQDTALNQVKRLVVREERHHTIRHLDIKMVWKNK